MNDLKCPNCGADITTDESQTSGKCSYCNSRFASEKKPEPEPQSKTTNTIQENFTAIYNAVRPKKQRPRIRFGILLLLLFFGGPVFIIPYIIIVEIRKKMWDEKYSNNPNVRTDS